MVDFGDEFTIESYRIPWLIWIQLLAFILLIFLLYCFSFTGGKGNFWGLRVDICPPSTPLDPPLYIYIYIYIYIVAKYTKRQTQKQKSPFKNCCRMYYFDKGAIKRNISFYFEAIIYMRSQLDQYCHFPSYLQKRPV
jgi:hypothetical protein